MPDVTHPMTAVFRQNPGELIQVSNSWSLDEQIIEIARWLSIDSNMAMVHGSTLDIGFNARLNDQVAIQGETIPVDFMRQLVAANITLWLSIYPPFNDDV